MFTKKRAKNAKNMLQLVGYYTNMGEESDINVSRRYIYILSCCSDRRIQLISGN